MMDVPPSRYQVVERGRRLVVIDRRTGQPVSREAPVREETAAPARPTGQSPIDQTLPSAVDDRSGNAVLRTSPLYDLKAPRRIVVNDRLSKTLGWALAMGAIGATVLTLFFPFLWLGVAFALFQPKLRGGIRAWITAQLDAADQAAS